MHCRPSRPINDSLCSSFLFAHPNCTNTLNYHISSLSSYHDEVPPPPPRRRRRLEDPIITYASNYYATYPRQTSHSPPPSPQSLESPPLPTPRRIYQQIEHQGTYCDLYNLLERPPTSPPPVKQRRKYTLNDDNSCSGHCSIVYKNAHVKVKDINERKRHQQQQQSSYYKEKRPQKDKLSSIQHNDRLQENTKTNNCIHQRHSSSKGFFRRVARNYFCIPITFTNGEFSN